MAQPHAVADAQALTVDGQRAAGHVDVGEALGRQREALLLGAVEQAGVDAGVLMDRQRALGAVRRDDQAQPSALVGGVEVLLLVARGDALAVRYDPDLQEVHRLLAGGVVLAVAHAGAGAHHLHVAGADHRAGAHRVLVLQRAFEHVGEDLHVAVAMGVEAAALAHVVLVDHQQVGEADVLRVVVAAEGKAVLRVQPAEVGDAALGGRPDFQHVDLLLGLRGGLPGGAGSGDG
ncbi:hypothetical protein D3C80_1112650 [compost metagenome]